MTRKQSARSRKPVKAFKAWAIIKEDGGHAETTHKVVAWSSRKEALLDTLWPETVQCVLVSPARRKSP